MISHSDVDRAEVQFDETDSERPITVVLSDRRGNIFRGFLTPSVVSGFGSELVQAGQQLEKPKAGKTKTNKGRQRTRNQNR